MWAFTHLLQEYAFDVRRHLEGVTPLPDLEMERAIEASRRQAAADAKAQLRAEASVTSLMTSLTTQPSNSRRKGATDATDVTDDVTF